MTVSFPSADSSCGDSSESEGDAGVTAAVVSGILFRELDRTTDAPALCRPPADDLAALSTKSETGLTAVR